MYENLIMEKDTVLTINTILTECWKRDIYPRPLKLQKLLYFCHGEYLAKNGEELISDHFEAWGYGCVVPEVYHAFKHWGYRGIGSLLLDGGEKRAYVLSENSDKYPVIRDVVEKYCRIDDMTLSDINHKADGAWWKARMDHRSEIKREDIIEEFRK